METKKEPEDKKEIYKRRAHNVGISMWHLQWCTKYRYKVFRQEYIRQFCEVAIKEGCARNKIEIIAMNVQPDHVHIVVALPRGMTDIKALNFVKGFSSFILFRLVPNFRRRYSKGRLWAPSSFSATVGYTELETVVGYVKNQ